MRSLIAAALLCASASAQALDSVAFVYGEGNHAGVYAGELRTDEWRRWPLGSRWQLSAYGMGSIGYWRAREETVHKELWDFGLAPVLRLEKPREGAMPYFEASLGVHMLSGRHINGNREFSTNFQFGDLRAHSPRAGSGAGAVARGRSNQAGKETPGIVRDGARAAIAFADRNMGRRGGRDKAALCRGSESGT